MRLRRAKKIETWALDRKEAVQEHLHHAVVAYQSDAGLLSSLAHSQ